MLEFYIKINWIKGENLTINEGLNKIFLFISYTPPEAIKNTVVIRNSLNYLVDCY